MSHSYKHMFTNVIHLMNTQIVLSPHAVFRDKVWLINRSLRRYEVPPYRTKICILYINKYFNMILLICLFSMKLIQSQVIPFENYEIKNTNGWQ